MEKLIRASHLRRYIWEPARRAETTPTVKRIAASSKLQPKPRPTINYILGSSVDDQYQSKRQRRKLLRAATVRTWVNTISTPDNSRAIQLVNGHISFPLINLSRVITPYHDALVLTLCINNFDVHGVLVDLGNAANMLQLPTFRQMKVPLDKLSSAGRILSRFNGETTLTMGGITLPVKVRPVIQQVLFSVVEDLRSYNAIVSRA